MDDGTPICVAVTIDARTRRAVFDFAGTGPEVYGVCGSRVVCGCCCEVTRALVQAIRTRLLLSRTRPVRARAVAVLFVRACACARVCAVIYVLRCLVDRDIPLNQGCLAPVDIRIPPSCILSPSPTAAVVGGNVLTSQRVVDVLLKAFGGRCACVRTRGGGAAVPAAQARPRRRRGA